MGLVILAALCVAGFAVTFRFFERYNVALLPAITINYATAFLCGLMVAPPDLEHRSSSLWLPAALLGSLFVVIFSITGLSAQKAGAARTTIAGRMSLVLTIIGTVILFNEHIGAWALVGIAFALLGLYLTATGTDEARAERSWSLPALLFLCSGAADIGVTVVQRVITTPQNASSFPTLCFGASTCGSVLLLLIRKEHQAIVRFRTWTGGAVLGVVNYASLFFLVQALGAGRYPATVIFPMMNILAIVFATAAALVIFRERLSTRQWCGIALCVAALALIMGSNT